MEEELRRQKQTRPPEAFYRVPEGYFKALPDQIRARTVTQRPAGRTVALTWAARAAAVLALALTGWWVARPDAAPAPDASALLAGLSAEDARYFLLEETALSNGELLELLAAEASVTDLTTVPTVEATPEALEEIDPEWFDAWYEYEEVL